MKKMILIIPVLMLGILAGAQHLETTIKIVGGKARIAIKAVGGEIIGSPDNFIFSVAIPKAIADAGATLHTPTVLLTSPTRVPATLDPIVSYSDADSTYFNLFYSGATGSATFADGVEYEILELNWAGAAQFSPVTLVSMPDGNPSAPVAGFQWLNYLTVGGTPFSFGDVLFYASATSTINSQMAAADYSAGTARVTTNTLVSLPASLLNFSGYKNGTKNTLRWTTTSEMNNKGFEVQRSSDGTNYSAIGYVNSQAPGGGSVSNLDYTFDDNSAGGKKQFYRLKQEDIDGRAKISEIIMINGDKPKTLGISSLFPNPASSVIKVRIDSPKSENLTLVVMDISGKTIKQQSVNVNIGSNTVPVDIASLAKGSYLMKVLCQSSDCEAATGKFTKQ